MTRQAHVRVRALRTQQGAALDVYSFFVRGDQIAEIADITRLRRSEGQLDGFQRGEIKSHVAEIALRVWRRMTYPPRPFSSDEA